jgi:hypothetical protein
MPTNMIMIAEYLSTYEIWLEDLEGSYLRHGYNDNFSF